MSELNPQRLQQLLHREIPLSRAMDVSTIHQDGVLAVSFEGAYVALPE